MLSRVLVRLQRVPGVLLREAQRNIAVSAAVYQKAQADPIQELFLNNIREYAKKSKSVHTKYYSWCYSVLHLGGSPVAHSY